MLVLKGTFSEEGEEKMTSLPFSFSTLDCKLLESRDCVSLCLAQSLVSSELSINVE